MPSASSDGSLADADPLPDALASVVSAGSDADALADALASVVSAGSDADALADADAPASSASSSSPQAAISRPATASTAIARRTPPVFIVVMSMPFPGCKACSTEITCTGHNEPPDPLCPDQSSRTCVDADQSRARPSPLCAGPSPTPASPRAPRAAIMGSMSVVKINAVDVPAGMGDEFLQRFAKRAGSVEDQPGFEEFLLLRPTDDSRRFFVFTRWESEEAFQTWLSGDDFAKAHAHLAEDQRPERPEGAAAPPTGHGHGQGGGHGHGGDGPVAVNAELLAFEVMERVTKA